MFPKDLLVHLESGDRTQEMLFQKEENFYGQSVPQMIAQLHREVMEKTFQGDVVRWQRVTELEP